MNKNYFLINISKQQSSITVVKKSCSNLLIRTQMNYDSPIVELVIKIKFNIEVYFIYFNEWPTFFKILYFVRSIVCGKNDCFTNICT